jgi:hypothetical protein
VQFSASPRGVLPGGNQIEEKDQMAIDGSGKTVYAVLRGTADRQDSKAAVMENQGRSG